MVRSIVIVDEPHRRDPMQYELYEYLERSTRIRFRHFEGGPVPTCDALFLGLNYAGYLKQLMPAMAKLPVILDNNDIECFVEDPVVRRLFVSGSVRLLFTKYYPSPRLDAFAASVGFPRSRICLIPWACDSRIYEGGGARDLDVCYPVTIDPTWKYHRHRATIAAIVRSIPNSYVGNVYGSDYLRVLQRSRIFVVDGSDRHAMTQKYIQGAMCGCLLVGDVPTIPDIAAGCFIDGKTMVSTNDDWRTLDGRIRYFLEHSGDREEMAAVCRSLVTRAFNLAHWGEVLQDHIIRTLGWVDRRSDNQSCRL